MTKKGKVEQPVEDHRFLNREASWLAFNERVLHEAEDPTVPLLERLKFLAIFESNLDEFYMVRVSGLIEQHEAGIKALSTDGLLPEDQLELISTRAIALRQRAAHAYIRDIWPQLEKNAIHIKSVASLRPEKREELREYFLEQVFSLCTPLVLYPAHSVPFISNRSLNILVELGGPDEDLRLARVKVPSVIPRAIRLTPKRNDFVFLEDLIIENIQSLFPGIPIRGAHCFRVIRDADIEIRELEAADLISMTEETIRKRRFGDPVALQIESKTPEAIRTLLQNLLSLDPADVFSLDGPIGFEVFWELYGIEKPALRDPKHTPYLSEQLSSFHGIFEAAARKDVLLHHPYDSFRTVEEFVAAAAKDPQTVGIKISLYRVGAESPIVESLLEAAEAGKQVAVMVELKARFDESNNLVWSRALERAGVHVTYGFSEMKTHAKLCLVVRREGGRMKSYAHIGTGNYNPATSRIYTDLGLITCDEDITQDIAELFNYLTGFSRQTSYRSLLVAPVNLREKILEKIANEVANKKAGKPAEIVWKVNALVDPEVIDALYEASNAGVKVTLLVRGICCLRPGVKKFSENIHVISVIGRFLEHSRIYWFANAGKPSVYIGSADAMRRNLDRRVEVLTPVEDTTLQKHIRQHILAHAEQDHLKAWVLQTNGHYVRPRSGKFSSQQWFMDNPSTKALGYT